jgi:hypothetical protein
MLFSRRGRKLRKSGGDLSGLSRSTKKGPAADGAAFDGLRHLKEKALTNDRFPVTLDGALDGSLSPKNM